MKYVALFLFIWAVGIGAILAVVYGATGHL